MRKGLRRLLITGGAGFMGSECVRVAVKKGYRVVVIDKLTYAADLERLEEVKGRYRFYKEDICDKKAVEKIVRRERPQAILHFAAETHVDRSIVNADPFLGTNIKGTKVLIDAAKKFRIPRFMQISTDEVYGDIKKGSFSEDAPLKPNSPYAASKAAADLLVKAYMRTYSFPALIVRPSNNYGPWQYPEKLIPLAILRASNNEKIPLYAKGKNAREWLFVSDCVKAILLILEKGKTGEVYNVGSGQERKNIEVAKAILKNLSRPKSSIKFVKDRPGHDLRYSLDSNKLKRLGWKAKIKFREGIKRTVEWYGLHKSWLEKHQHKKLSIKF
ncbi:MAG: dTDP-glucose 4,6-dehydratase [Omnitrophica WOR_2 bacterium SM23_72]|nr:MAG: dTDP-glucose 4,6-dehydratase [Omnitrophica WOR_2 bacterium SM23_72]